MLMNKKIICFGIGILVIIIVFVFMNSKRSTEITTVQGNDEIKTKCYEECADVFSKSPVGVGPEAVMCGNFSSGQPISANCKLFFENNPISVSVCEDYLDIKKRVVEMATGHLSFPTTIVEVKELGCYGCFSITLQRDDNQDQFTITLNDWKIVNYE